MSDGMKIDAIARSAKIPFIVSFVYVSFYTVLYFILTNGGQSSMGNLGLIMSVVKLLLYAGLSFYGGWIAAKKFNLDKVFASLAGAAGPVATEIILDVFFFFYYLYNFGMTSYPTTYANYFGVEVAYYPGGQTIEIVIIAVICLFCGLVGALFAKRSR